MKQWLKMGRAFVAVIAAVLLLAACSSSEDDKDTAKKLKESNERVKEMEAEEEFVFRKEDSGMILTKYNGNDSDVEIPEEYNGEKVVGIEAGAFKNYAQIRSVTIPYTVQSMDYELLPEDSGIVIRGYSDTMAEIFANDAMLQFESLGENPMQVTTLTVFNKENSEKEELVLGKAPESDFLKGVTFETVDGKSVLTLDNCDIGAVMAEEIAALTIRLADGSENKITGARGNDGIYVNGNLTITGAGSLEVVGSDTYTIREGERVYAGSGIVVTFLDLVIEERAQVMAKAGTSKSRFTAGILLNSGSLVVKNSRLEAMSPSEGASFMAAVVAFSNTENPGENLKLEGAKISEGGAMVPFVSEDGDVFGSAMGSGEQVLYDDALGFDGASNYVRIEPEAGQ